MKRGFNQSWRKKQSEFYSSEEWRALRAEVIKRDHRVCHKCGKIIFGKAIAHHLVWLTPENIDDPNVSLNIDNCVTTCDECHKKIHDKGFKKEVIVNDDLTIDYSKR